MSSEVHQDAVQHLLREDGQEDLCFALWYPSQGSERTSALVHQLILPREDEREVHGNASFLPNYFERALQKAIDVKAGLAFIHSHLGPGWQGMSGDDIFAEQRHAPASYATTELPLVGLTLGTDGAWSARFWVKTGPRQYDRQWCDNVRVIGGQLLVNYCDELLPKPKLRRQLERTRSAWGDEIQGNLARLHVGIVGAGSVGSCVGEALARMGIQHIRLFDYDDVECINLDRLLHASQRDADIGRAKVEVLARGLRKSATADLFRVDSLDFSIVEEEGFRAALDCDVLLSCVDRNWPRSVLNLIAYAHLIPVIDGGVLVEANKSGQGVRHADIRAHVACYDHRCLECLNQYNPGLVNAEREGYVDDPEYIKGLPRNHAFRRNENVFSFSITAASLEILQLLSLVVSPLGLVNPGSQIYHFIPGSLDTEWDGCKPNCIFPGMVALGDNANVKLTGRDPRAERMREARLRRKDSWSYRLRDWIDFLRLG